MKYYILIFAMFLTNICICKSKLEKLVITNSFSSKMIIQFFDKYYNFTSIPIDKDSSLSVYFEGCLSLKVSINYKSKPQLLCVKSDSIYLTREDMVSNKRQLSSHTLLFNPEIFQDTTLLHEEKINVLIDETTANLSAPDAIKAKMKENLIYFFFDSYLFNPHTSQNRTKKVLEEALLFGKKHLLSNKRNNDKNYLYDSALIKYNDLYITAYSNADKIFEIIKSNYNTTQQDILLFNALNRLVVKRENDFLINYPKYESTIVNVDYKNHLQKIYSSLTQPSTKKTMLMRYSDYKIIPIDSIYLQHHGKNIVYDFSASWCSPCLENIGTLIAHVNHEHNTTYAIINLDKNINSWLPIIEQYKLNPENCYFMIDGVKSDFAKKHKIDSIPRYMYISRTGNIIDGNYNIHE